MTGTSNRSGKPATSRTRKTWTRTDYLRAQHTAKQEFLLKELVNHLMASGRTNHDLASQTGVSPTTIEAWRRGDRKFAMTRTLTAVGRALGGRLSWTWKP